MVVHVGRCGLHGPKEVRKEKRKKQIVNEKEQYSEEESSFPRTETRRRQIKKKPPPPFFLPSSINSCAAGLGLPKSSRRIRLAYLRMVVSEEGEKNTGGLCQRPGLDPFTLSQLPAAVIHQPVY